MSGIRWHAPEYIHRQKSRDWFWAVGIIGFSLTATALIFGNIVPALLVVIAAVTLFLTANREPSIIAMEANDEGIVIGRQFYPYDALESFWVAEGDGGGPRLLLNTKRGMIGIITVPLSEVEPATLRLFLKNFLPMEQVSEPLSQKILEFFGL